MKKIYILLFSLLLVINLTACGGNEEFSNLSKEEKIVYKDLTKLYGYVKELNDKQVNIKELLKNKEFKSLFDKYANYENNELNEDLDTMISNLIITIATYQSKIENEHKDVLNNRIFEIQEVIKKYE